ncbi:PREDICTED: uncharacterized protein LOC108360586 [Rhagoletis zephyria]|uniref:uncharacterized protein LOC108360586 n=1 Tax=Rhagoletis zephyria TaxID=28612 RepID=UPI0008119EDA|nr:PREDICTED: uncharacterized protein LOC108360586 [Rhagoletis zephyria]
MEEEIIAFYLWAKKLEAEIRNAQRRNLRCLRDREDPFALDENTFRGFFRLPKSFCWDLIQGLKPHDSRKFGISFELRFISVLYFLSNGSYQSCVGSGHFCAMSQASVSRNINYICRLVVEHKHSELAFPIRLNKTTI